MSAAAPSPPAGAQKSFREVWLITIGHGLTHWYPSTFYLLLPLIGRELGLSYSEIGFVMSCQFMAGAISNIPGGMVVDTIARKNLLLAVSLFWIGFPYLLMAFTHSYWMLIACVVLVDIGNNLWHPTAIPALASRYPERKGMVLSVHGMGGNLGDAIAPLAIGALLAVLSWREVVVLNVIPGVIVAILILAMLGSIRVPSVFERGQGAAGDASRGRSLADFGRGLRDLLRNRSLIVLMLSSAFRSMTQSSLLVFLPLFLANEMGYSSFAIGGCLFALQAAGFTAGPIAGHLSDKLGRRKVVISTMAMSAVVLLFMAIAGRSPAFVFFIGVLGFFLFATRPVLQAWLLETTPSGMGGTSIGVMFAAQALGASISPMIGGLIADRYGLIATFYFLAATIVVANITIFFMPGIAAEAKARAAAKPAPGQAD